MVLKVLGYLEPFKCDRETNGQIDRQTFWHQMPRFTMLRGQSSSSS